MSQHLGTFYNKGTIVNRASLSVCHFIILYITSAIKLNESSLLQIFFPLKQGKLPRRRTCSTNISYTHVPNRGDDNFSLDHIGKQMKEYEWFSKLSHLGEEVGVGRVKATDAFLKLLNNPQFSFRRTRFYQCTPQTHNSLHLNLKYFLSQGSGFFLLQVTTSMSIWIRGHSHWNANAFELLFK